MNGNKKFEDIKDEDVLFSNGYKIGFTEDAILLQFRGMKSKKDEEEYSVVFPAVILQDLIVDLFKAGINYQKEFNETIGFDIEKEGENE